MKIIKLINPENVSNDEAKEYPVREAVRAMVVDREGTIALLHVAKESYYKLPGGGIEFGEDKMYALKRECLEEIGCDVEVTGEIGIIIEYRKIFNLKQISYCYSAKVIGEKGKPDFTDDEKDNGFEQIWLPFEKTLNGLASCEASDIEGSAYIVPRDTAFLEEAKTLIE